MANPTQPHFDEDRLQFVRNREPDVTVADETGAGTSGTSAEADVRHGSARVEVDVTAFDGSSLTVDLETTYNGTDWIVCESVTASGVETLTADVTGNDSPLGETVRATWSHDGTSADFTVKVL